MHEEQNLQRLIYKLQQAELRKDQSLKNTTRKLSREYRRELHSIIGRKNLRRYEEMRSRHRKHLLDIGERVDPTFVGEAKIQEARRKANKESQEFLKEIGLDRERALNFSKKYRKRFQTSISEILGTPKKRKYFRLRKQATDSHTNSIILEPPYQHTFDSGPYTHNSSLTQERLAYPVGGSFFNAATGEMGSWSTVCTSNLREEEWSRSYHSSSIIGTYTMPEAGHLAVTLRLKTLFIGHWGVMRDESGWSEATCDQESYVFLNAFKQFPPWLDLLRDDRSYSLDYHREFGWSDVYWGNIEGMSGWISIRDVDLISHNFFDRSDLVYFVVGAREWHNVRTNDVSADCILHVHYILDRVRVRSSSED